MLYGGPYTFIPKSVTMVGGETHIDKLNVQFAEETID